MLDCKVSATPILDLEQDPPAPPRAWVPTVVGVLIGLIVVAIQILGEQSILPSWHWPAFNGLLLIPALYISIAVHEIGHLAAGKLLGLDTGGISVGAFRWIKSGENWVFRFDRRTWLGGFYKPLTGAANFEPSRHAWMVAAGPIASVLLAIVCGLIAAQSGGGSIWAGTLFWSSASLAMLSAMPFRSGLNRSDGARFWQLLRHPEQARLWMALLDLQTEEAKGIRPREWSPLVFDQILTIDVSANEYPYCQLMAFYRKLDEGEETLALEHLENAIARSARAGRAMRHALFLEAASAGANIGRQAGKARAWRDRACKLQKPESLAAVDGGIAMCEGRYEEAIGHWEAAQTRVARRKLDSGLIRFVKEKWAGYEAECRSAGA